MMMMTMTMTMMMMMTMMITIIIYYYLLLTLLYYYYYYNIIIILLLYCHYIIIIELIIIDNDNNHYSTPLMFLVMPREARLTDGMTSIFSAYFGRWPPHKFCCMDFYPLVICYITMERSTIFNGKIHYFYGHFQ